MLHPFITHTHTHTHTHTERWKLRYLKVNVESHRKEIQKVLSLYNWILFPSFHLSFLSFWPHQGLWDQGLNPNSWQSKCRVLTAGLPGNSLEFLTNQSHKNLSSFCRVEREGESKKDTEAEGTACAKEEIRKGLENYAMYKLGVGVVTVIAEKLHK